MKTLDEVIETAPYVGTEWTNNALHYLKEYREKQEMLSYWSEKAISEQQNLADAYMLYKIASEKEKEKDNPPLTWSELQQMEGKPVWVEAESLSVGVSPYWKDWYIIKSFSNDEFMYCNDGFEWAKEMQGRLWQAYRKERE